MVAYIERKNLPVPVYIGSIDYCGGTKTKQGPDKALLTTSLHQWAVVHNRTHLKNGESPCINLLEEIVVGKLVAIVK